jgi:hypothetical protein
MSRFFLRMFIIFVIWTWSPGAVRAQNPGPQNQPAEPIPAPIAPPLPPIIEYREVIVIPQPRPGTREVWSTYGVDSTGRFRPRVVVTPYGAFNQQTLQPYPWLTYNPRLYLAR